MHPGSESSIPRRRWIFFLGGDGSGEMASAHQRKTWREPLLVGGLCNTKVSVLALKFHDYSHLPSCSSQLPPPGLRIRYYLSLLTDQVH